MQNTRQFAQIGGTENGMLFALPPPLPDEVARTPAYAAMSQAVVDVFHEACETGALRLPASRGKVLQKSEVPPIADVLRTFRQSLNQRVIQFNYPPKTYLILADFKPTTSRSIVKTCTIVSKAVTTSDANRALVWNIEKGEPEARWIPNMYLREWKYDRPDLGFRKRMRFRDDKSVLLEVATYANSESAKALESK